MSLETSSILSPGALAEQAKNLRNAVKERRIKISKKDAKSSVPSLDSVAPMQLDETYRVQRAQEANDFFKHENASINTLVDNDENAISDCSESAIPLTLEEETSLSYDNDKGLWEVTQGNQTFIGKSLELKEGINLSYDSAKELLAITYRDQTLIGEQAFETKEYIDLNGTLRQASYIVKGQEPLITFFPKEEINLAKQVGKQSGLYESLEEKLQRIRNYYCDLESEWWSTSENNEAEKKEIQNQLIQIFNAGYDLIEHIDKHSTQTSNNAGTTTQTQNIKDIEKINQRIEELNNKIKNIKAGRSLSKTCERRLNILAGVIGVLLLCAGLGAAAGIWSVVFSMLKLISQEYDDHQSPQIKSKNLIQGAIDLLEQDINIQNARARNDAISTQQETQSSTEINEQLSQTQPAPVKTEEKSTQTLSEEILNSLIPVIEAKLSGVESDTTLTLAQHKKLKQEQVDLFQHEAQSLRNDLVEVLGETNFELAENEREQILSSLISSGVNTKQNYDQALQNLSIPEEIKSFLNKNGRQYWDSLQKLKALYLKEEVEITERQVKEIEAKLCAYAKIKHSEAKLASEEVVKAAEV